MLLVKCFVTPLLIVAATLITRQWGLVVGGLFTSLPLMSGPISVFLALEQGPAFAALAARASMFGFVSVGVYCLAYLHLSRRLSWLPAMLASSAAYFGSAALLQPLLRYNWLAVPASLALLALIIRLMGRVPARCGRISSPWWDLPIRVTAAGVMVLLVTGVAQITGSAWSGFLSTFPVFTALMAAFTRAEGGPDAAAMLMHGICIGMFGGIAFFETAALSLESLGIAPAYGLASLINLLVNAGIMFVITRRHPLPGQSSASESKNL